MVSGRGLFIRDGYWLSYVLVRGRFGSFMCV